MPNPQQPEVRRSERVPALSPDATEAVLEAEQTDQNQKHPHTPPELERDVVSRNADEPDQDKPDLDEFAERFGTAGSTERDES